VFEIKSIAVVFAAIEYEAAFSAVAVTFGEFGFSFVPAISELGLQSRSVSTCRNVEALYRYGLLLN
jgi:hypothetical protein